MSLRVLVIPEDFTKDGGALKLIVQAAIAEAGRPSANVQICQSPRFGGLDECLKVERIANEVIQRYRGMVDVFVQVVDRDGVTGRQAALMRIEASLEPALHGAAFISVMAWEEVETWILAGFDDLPTAWGTVRTEPHVKERFYLPYARKRDVAMAVAEGRRLLAAEAVRHWSRMEQRCKEDLGALVQRLRQTL